MKRIAALISLSLLLACTTAAQQSKKLVGGGCDGCELIFDGMPKQLNWETTVSGAGEPGEPMEIGGTIYKADGKTPAVGVILY
ncbi:MAG: intradiol ring-cleavage dioxygenase, partial [Blastocatellia bacterium]